MVVSFIVLLDDNIEAAEANAERQAEGSFNVFEIENEVRVVSPHL